MDGDWYHRGEFTPLPFCDGRPDKRRKAVRREKRAAAEQRHREREARGLDALVGSEEVNIRDGLTSPAWRRLFAEAMAKDAPYEDYPHVTALREQYIRQLLHSYRREGVPRE